MFSSRPSRIHSAKPISSTNTAMIVTRVLPCRRVPDFAIVANWLQLRLGERTAGALVGVCYLEDGRFVERLADYLHRKRQSP
jgi:hypothetical protein